MSAIGQPEPDQADTAKILVRIHELADALEERREEGLAAAEAVAGMVLFETPAAVAHLHLASEVLLGVYANGKLGRWPDEGGVIDDLGVHWTPAMFEAGLRLLNAFAQAALERQKETA